MKISEEFERFRGLGTKQLWDGLTQDMFNLCKILMEDNAKMQNTLRQISRMKTLPDHASNTFTLVTAHTLAEQALAETSIDREIM